MTGTRREILREAIELRRKQDIRRDRVYRRSTVLVGGVLTVGTIAVTLLVSPAIEATTAQIAAGTAGALVLAAINGLFWYGTQAAPLTWHEGPDIAYLMRTYRNSTDARALLDELIETHEEHRKLNEVTIGRLQGWVGAQAAVTFVAICLLVGAVIALG